MAEYICPACDRKSRLPDFCCGELMVERGKFYCESCKSQSAIENTCCGSSMRQI